MEIEIKKINNGWLVTITGHMMDVRNESVIPVEHFEPTLDKVFVFIKKSIGVK